MCNFQDLFDITRRKKNKTSVSEVLHGKNGKKIYLFIYLFVVLYYYNLAVDFQCLIAACQKHILMFLINMPRI